VTRSEYGGIVNIYGDIAIPAALADFQAGVLAYGPSPTTGQADMNSPYQPEIPVALALLHKELGIPDGYCANTSWTLYPEPAELMDAGPDYAGRPLRLTPAALTAWQDMQRSAAQAGVTLFLVSGFRSIDYQCELIRRKLARGMGIAEILKVNAAPGFSEHHTGRAIDIGTLDSPVLEQAFETTPAYRWLQTHAAHFGFHLSYPRGNAAGILFEPWHWCYEERGGGIQPPI
jgi:zinc D-Ala-D-Ala carboxypeptidase